MRRKHYNFKGGGLLQDRLRFGSPIRTPVDFPVPWKVDSEAWCLPADDQERTSSCAGRATAGAIEVWNWHDHYAYKQQDAMLIYNTAIGPDGDPDGGTTLEAAIGAAKTLKLISNDVPLRRVSSLLDLQFALHRNCVCIGGFKCCEAWNEVDIETGNISLNDGAFLGGHAVLVCGYNIRTKRIQFQNSWGTKWGKDGFGSMTFEQFGRQWMYGITLDLL